MREILYTCTTAALRRRLEALAFGLKQRPYELSPVGKAEHSAHLGEGSLGVNTGVEGGM